MTIFYGLQFKTFWKHAAMYGWMIHEIGHFFNKNYEVGKNVDNFNAKTAIEIHELNKEEILEVGRNNIDKEGNI